MGQPIIDLEDDEIQAHIGSVEELFETLDSEKARYMNRAKQIRNQISEAKKDAKAAGIPMRSLNAVLIDRKLERKQEANKASLEGQDVDAFDQITEVLDALDGTPLANAAAKSKKDGKKGGGTKLDPATDSAPSGDNVTQLGKAEDDAKVDEMQQPAAA